MAIPAENPLKHAGPVFLHRESGGSGQEKSSDWLSPVTSSITCRMPTPPGFPRTITPSALKILHPMKPLSPLDVGRGRICPLGLLFPKTAYSGRGRGG